jgi:hypothetical protein
MTYEDVTPNSHWKKNLRLAIKGMALASLGKALREKANIQTCARSALTSRLMKF